ncbi:MAG TPA: succinylglutamate desuccinylase/aspartoacylase family protein [Bacilli bacterium]|nr:succinylglutamate desuccinylase/aspartoacylase family protein [Bacilli bacterium]
MNLTKKTNILITSLLLLITVILTIICALDFKSFANYETEFVLRDDVITRVEKFSKYSPKLTGTVGDSNIYVIAGEEPGPSLLIIGGTHPNEPSSQLTATLILENITVTKGTVYIITEANKSAFTHSQPQEASSLYYHIETANSLRTFRFGSRATNNSQQWPNPDIYVHRTSGQKLSNIDTRNLNRAYPGCEDGTYTEKVAYAITQCIIQNDIDVTIDLHEASPEYLTINAIVAHQRSTSVAAKAAFKMDMQGVLISLEVSPVNLHGLSHRELGDFTNTLAFLCETANASQGKIRGKFTEDLIITGDDKFYKKASELGVLYAAPVHINERVARHALVIASILSAYNDIYGAGELGDFIVNNIPDYENIIANGVGYYLLDSSL